jgi:hypothetical protein
MGIIGAEVDPRFAGLGESKDQFQKELEEIHKAKDELRRSISTEAMQKAGLMFTTGSILEGFAISIFGGIFGGKDPNKQMARERRRIEADETRKMQQLNQREKQLAELAKAQEPKDSAREEEKAAQLIKKKEEEEIRSNMRINEEDARLHERIRRELAQKREQEDRNHLRQLEKDLHKTQKDAKEWSGGAFSGRAAEKGSVEEAKMLDQAAGAMGGRQAELQAETNQILKEVRTILQKDKTQSVQDLGDQILAGVASII